MAETRIDILRDRVAELEALLKPFAEYVRGIEPTPEGMTIVFGMLAEEDHTGWVMDASASLTMRNFIEARAALSPPDGKRG